MSNYKCNFNYNKNYNKPSISYNKQHKGNIICNNCYYNNCLKDNDDDSKKIDCMNYSGDLYKKCNFYWHKRTSKHNKRLCSNAQAQEGGRFTGV